MHIYESNNYRILSLLIGHEKFQTFVKEVRNFLKIPNKGFVSNEGMQKWTKESDSKSDSYLNSEEYKTHNLNIRKKIKLGEIDIAMASKQLRLLDQKLRFNYLTDSCLYITTKFNLPSHFDHVIRRYILWNKFDFVFNKNFAFIPDLKNKRVAKIEVYSRLTKEEEKSLLKLIKNLTKDFPKMEKISKTTIRQLSVEDWHKDREKYSEKITAKDMAKEYLGSSKKYQQIYDSGREINRKRKKLFG